MFLKTLLANSPRGNVRMPIFPEILNRQVSFPTNSRRKWYLMSICVLFDELHGFYGKSIARLLSPNTPTPGDPRLGIRITNTPLT